MKADYIEKLLNKNNILFEKNKSFDGCVYKNRLRFKFYLPEYHACVVFYNDENNRCEKLRNCGVNVTPYTKKQIQEDIFKTKIKFEFCRLNNIQTIIIKNDENLELIPEKIKNLDKCDESCEKKITFKFQPFYDTVIYTKKKKKETIEKKCLVEPVIIDVDSIQTCTYDDTARFRTLCDDMLSLLDIQKIQYETTKKFKGCYSLTGNDLSFSVYLPEYHCCILYDSYYNNMFVGNNGIDKQISNLQRSKTHFEAKKKFCEINNINLIIVKYDDTIESVITKLKGVIGEN